MYPIKTFILGILKILENLNKGKIIDILGKKTEVNVLKKNFNGRYNVYV